MEESWRNHGGIMEASWRHRGGIMEASWRHRGGIVEASWRHRGRPCRSYIHTYIVAGHVAHKGLWEGLMRGMVDMTIEQRS